MKTIFNTLFIALVLAVATLAGCKDEMGFNNSGVVSVTPVWPEDGTSVELFNSEVATLDFKWEAANAAGAPYYQIVFYAADRTTELYRIAPTDRQLLISVAHRTLNAVAGMADIAPNTSGEVYWAVATVKGTIEELSAMRKLTLKSYQVFDDLPVSLYIVGAATEGGDNITAAPKFKVTGEGTYEIYTSLRAGEIYYFTNRNTSGGGRNFTVVDDFLVETEGAPAAPLTVAAEGVYFIRLNFMTAKMTTTAITNVRYFVPTTNTYTPMTYDGYGKWSLHVTLGSLTSSSNQYKFVANVGGTDRSWGCNTQDGQGNPPQILEGDYFYVYQHAHSTSSDNRARYSYRYMLELSNQEIDLLLDMSSDNDNYTHVVDAGDLTVYPVEQFNAPAENASVALSKVPGSSLTFSWQPSAGTGPTPKYDVVFYSDAEGATEIGTAPANNNKYAATATVLHTAMEAIAAAANIPAEGTGDIWWSVRTTVLTQSEIATASPRKLTVTRLPGIPAAVYITGAASEAGTTLGNAMAMKKTADGIFEIYTKLVAGTFCFVDRTSGTPRQFSVSGTAISEGGNTTATAGVYKIVLNFNTDVAAYSAITNVEFFHPWGEQRVQLTYTTNGEWTGSVTPSGWATDERYKFKVTSNPDGVKDWIGIARRDCPPTGSADFYYMKEGEQEGTWTSEDGNMWKIPNNIGGWNANTFNITFTLRADAPYTHMVTW